MVALKVVVRRKVVIRRYRRPDLGKALIAEFRHAIAHSVVSTSTLQPQPIIQSPYLSILFILFCCCGHCLSPCSYVHDKIDKWGRSRAGKLTLGILQIGPIKIGLVLKPTAPSGKTYRMNRYGSYSTLRFFDRIRRQNSSVSN